MDIENTPPPQLTTAQITEFTALCTELEDAAGDCDGDRAALILQRIGDIHPLLSRFMAEGIVEHGFASLARRMGDDDPKAYAIVRDMADKFGGDPR